MALPIRRFDYRPVMQEASHPLFIRGFMLYSIRPRNSRPFETRDPFCHLWTTKYMENISKTILPDASDEDLIRQFKSGNMDAFGELYKRYLPIVHKRVRYLVPAEDVEDVTQKIFIAVLKSMDTFRGEAHFGTWLRTLTDHKVVDFYRKRGRQKEAQLAPLSDASHQNDGNSVAKLEEHIVIGRALQGLPKKYREIILLRVIENVPYNEIAELNRSSLEATKSLYRRAISAFRELMEEEDEKHKK